MSYIDLTKSAAPATPASTHVDLYIGTSDKRLHSLDDAGTDIEYTGLNTSDTLTNKKFSDATCSFVDDGDATKVLNTSLGGSTTGTTLTLATAQSTSQTLNFPNITTTDTLVTTGLTQTITGLKTIVTPLLELPTITDSSDTTKVIAFVLSGMTSARTLTLSSSQSTNQTLTIPNITAGDTIVTTGLAQTITGQKTIANPNIVDASDNTKIFNFSLSGMTTNRSLTLSSTQSTSQTLSIPNITGASIVITDTLAQSITGVKTMTNMTTLAGTTSVPSMTITNGTNLTSAAANAIENDGTAFYRTTNTTNGRCYWDGWNYFRLTGSGGGITSIADFFGANSGIPLVANGVYEIEWHCYFSQATAGTATWTITTATTALASLTGEYIGSNIAGIGTVGAPQTAAINVTTSSATAFPVTGTEATGVTHYFTIRAMLQAGAGSSNTRLRLTMGAGTATPLINSYFRVRQLPGGNIGSFVA